MKKLEGKVSATEVPQYRRLAEFYAEVERYADSEGDTRLREIVDECRRDLLRMAGAPE